LTTGTTADAATAHTFGESVTRIWNSAAAWMSAHTTEILVALAVGTAIYFALHAVKRFANARARTSSDRYRLSTIVWRVLGKTSEVVILVTAIRLVSSYASPPAAVERTIAIAFTIAAVMQGAIWAREAILGFIQRRAGEHDTLENALTLIRLIVSVVVFAIAFVVVLDNLGVDVTGLVAGLGIGGIAIGLAAQGIFSDLFAALAVIFDKPFRRGDVIQVEGVVATVETIGLKSTRLRATTGEEVILANAKMLDQRIDNFTRLNRRRTRFAIGVIYQTKPAEARRIPDLLKAIVERHDAAFVRAGFVGFGDSALNFELDFDIMSTDFEVVFAGRHAIGLAIVEAFNDAGLEFAYPTQTTFTSAPDGTMIMPYPQVMPVVSAKE
jgi:small-conductance mechanosensitive channel